MATKNLFATAQVIKKTPAAKKDDKKMIIVQDPMVAKSIDELTEGRELEKKAKGLIAKAQSVLLPFGQAEWMKEYKQTKKRPESFIMSSKDNGVLFISADSYKSIDDERAEYLKETYGADIVETEEEFIINKEIIEKYADLISAAIMGIKEISDEEKAAIFIKREKSKIAKGTIENMLTIAENAKVTPEVLFSEIIPTLQLKGRGEK